MRYVILYDTSIHGLMAEVESYLSRGYRLSGGVCDGSVAFYQAVYLDPAWFNEKENASRAGGDGAANQPKPDGSHPA